MNYSENERKICNRCMRDTMMQGADWFYWIKDRIDNVVDRRILHFFDFMDTGNGFEKMEPSSSDLYLYMEHRCRVFLKLFKKAFESHGPTTIHRQYDYTKNSDHIKKSNYDPGKTYMMKKGKWVEVEIEAKTKEDTNIEIEVTYED